MSPGSARRLMRRVLPALALVVSTEVAEGAPPKGTPLMIVLPPEALAVAQGANGFVVAGNFYSGGTFHWMPTSGVTAIGGAGVAAVSRDGKVIAGFDRDPARIEQAAIWTSGGGWRLLGPLRQNAQPCDDLLTSAFGMNGDGRVVVGLGWDGCGYARAFRWEESTGMVDLGSLSGRSTRANSVSADGRVVVGWDTDPTGPRNGAKWVDGREESILGPGGPVGEAFAANRDGSLIVGGSCDRTDTVGPPEAWTWTQAAGVKCYPVIRPDWVPRLPYQAFMFATSDDGRVIGGSLSFGLDAEAIVWFDGEVVFLRDYLRANGIPDAFDGWINTGFVLAVSPDGRTLVGYAAGPRTFQGYVVILPKGGEE